MEILFIAAADAAVAPKTGFATNTLKKSKEIATALREVVSSLAGNHPKPCFQGFNLFVNGILGCLVLNCLIKLENHKSGINTPPTGRKSPFCLL